jgi:hypothetical protein
LRERVIDVENPETDFIAGRALRNSSPPSALAELIPSQHAATEIRIAQNANRLPELVPMRFAPTLPDPFSFYRGDGDRASARSAACRCQ